MELLSDLKENVEISISPNYPFPNEIANDPLVLYHGTSSCFEGQIESEGLKTMKE